MSNLLYPITIIKDRYNGIYSGGAFLAFNLDYDEIPWEINQDDVTCMVFWSTNKNMIVGRGATPQEAYENLCYRDVIQITKVETVLRNLGYQEEETETIIKCIMEEKENEI